MTNQKDLLTFEHDPIEYVRLQVDNQNEMNVKRQLSVFVERICGLKYGKRKDRLPPMHLQNYMLTIQQNLEQMQGQDAATEALLFAFGNLRDRCVWSGQEQMMEAVQVVLQNYAFPALDSPNPLLQARACWVYGRFASFEFKLTEHLQAAINKMVQHLYSNHIAVKVEAALAVSALLEHDVAVEFIRPGLGNVLKIFLKIMDDIDFEDLVNALRRIVDVYEDEIAPYAVSLCQKLSEAYVRLISSKGRHDDEDSEAGLTADGLMTAIRRVLNSISGRFPELYPQLEVILEQSILLSLSEAGATSTDEGLTCVSELIYNQTAVSPRMWQFYAHIVDSYLQDRGVLEQLVSQAAVPLINFMVKAPQEFKTANFEGHGTPIDMMFRFIAKIFSDGRELDDEIHSMCAVTLIMAILEHLGDGLQQQLHTINQFYLEEMAAADTKNYKNMLVQGIMMNFWYDQSLTLQSLQATGSLDTVFAFILERAREMDKDFEIKRLIIGLSTLTLSPQSSQVDPVVQHRFPEFMQAILVLCRRSLEIREKKM